MRCHSNLAINIHISSTLISKAILVFKVVQLFHSPRLRIGPTAKLQYDKIQDEQIHADVSRRNTYNISVSGYQEKEPMMFLFHWHSGQYRKKY